MLFQLSYYRIVVPFEDVTNLFFIHPALLKPGSDFQNLTSGAGREFRNLDLRLGRTALCL